MKKSEPQHNPKLLVVAGPNGSGKTSLTEQMLHHTWFDGCLYINPDQIAQEEYGGWNSPEATLQALEKATQRRQEAIAQHQSLALETVLSTQEKIDFLQQAKQQHYFIRLFFVATESPSINIARVAARYLEGGHEVPMSKIIARFSRSLANSIIAARLVDRAYFYDNSLENQLPRLLFRTKDGIIQKSYSECPNWAKEIAAQLV